MKKSNKRAPSGASELITRLAVLYPDSRCALNYESPLQLLVATILSAQCTDVRVNMVTPALFNRFPDAQAFAMAERTEVEGLIQSTGFFRNKATNIIGCCQMLVNLHGGEVPSNLEALVLLPGVGRKTANVVLGHCFGIPGITVDTHVGRLSRRLGLTEQEDPVKVEHELMQQWPADMWTVTSLRLIDHGRAVCDARKPACARCTLADMCPRVGVANVLEEKQTTPKPARSRKSSSRKDGET
jgi:endonuclease-3